MRRAPCALLAAFGLATGCGGAALPALDTANDAPVPVAGRSGGEASWLSRPATLQEAAQKADAGGVLTVEAVDAGEPVVAAPDEVNPTATVRLRVRDLWFGELGQTVTVRWLGTPGGGHMEGDPPYEVGQDYVLLLDRRSDGPWYRPESPDGRIQIHRERARPVIEGPIADTVKGWSAGQLKRAVQEGDT